MAVYQVRLVNPAIALDRITVPMSSILDIVEALASSYQRVPPEPVLPV